MTEMFPPTEQELEEIIKNLKAQLEDYRFQDDWPKINEELIQYENQLKNLTLTNNIL
ncbi:MAG: hypothetical protein L6264_07450 [Weeksellaceae bacterium]|nr:hypothetical protein [Bacteroidota bacterium]MCG2780769.1 hypothetical protein [Weeksellaceae bacterium]